WWFSPCSSFTSSLSLSPAGSDWPRTAVGAVGVATTSPSTRVAVPCALLARGAAGACATTRDGSAESVRATAAPRSLGTIVLPPLTGTTRDYEFRLEMLGRYPEAA